MKFGGLFNHQVAGLTNNSYIAEAHEVRHCVQKYKVLGKYVLQVAKVILKVNSCISWLFNHPTPQLLLSSILFKVCTCTSCRRDLTVCYMLVLLRSTENLQQCLQMWLVLRLYHNLMHQTPAWIVLKIQVSVV